MPTRAISHIQNTAPGPPRVMAPATPATLPVPMVAARAVVRLPKALTSPSPWLLRIETAAWRMPNPIRRRGMKRSPTIR